MSSRRQRVLDYLRENGPYEGSVADLADDLGDASASALSATVSVLVREGICGREPDGIGVKMTRLWLVETADRLEPDGEPDPDPAVEPETPAVVEPDPDPEHEFGRLTGSVADAGGGHVDLLVDRDTERYPEVGARVALVPEHRWEVFDRTTRRPVSPSAGYVEVAGRCPACRSAALFLADDGYVTCSYLECPNPLSASEFLRDPHGEAAAQVAPEPTGRVSGDVFQAERALADGLAEALRLSAEWSQAIDLPGWSHFDALNTWRERRGFDPLPPSGRPHGVSADAEVERADVETVQRDPRDETYGDLHNARERLCRAQTRLPVLAWRAMLDDAVARIDYVGARECVEQWSRFDRTDLGVPALAALDAPPPAERPWGGLGGPCCGAGNFGDDHACEKQPGGEPADGSVEAIRDRWSARQAGAVRALSSLPEVAEGADVEWVAVPLPARTEGQVGAERAFGVTLDVDDGTLQLHCLEVGPPYVLDTDEAYRLVETIAKALRAKLALR